MSLILPTTVRGFHDYFKLTADPRSLAEAFGFTFEADILLLKESKEPLIWLSELENRLTYALKNLIFDTETARREFLIAPVLFEISRHVNSVIRSEFVIRATPQLKGTLDYLLTSSYSLLVVEAKQSDLTRGFSQLVSELVALDYVVASEINLLYGAVSYGEVWRFGCLDRKKKLIIQDLNLFTVPHDIESLIRRLIHVLSEKRD